MYCVSINMSQSLALVLVHIVKAKATMVSARKAATVRFPLANPPGNRFFHRAAADPENLGKIDSASGFRGGGDGVRR